VRGLGDVPWQATIAVTSALAVLAAGPVWRVRTGPAAVALATTGRSGGGPRTGPAPAAAAAAAAATLGYLGHIWELYAL
jgi:hypothetical protein